MSPSIAADAFRELDDDTRTKLRALPSNDSVLAEALRKSRVVLGNSGLPFAVAQPEGTQPPIGLATMGGDPRRYLLNFPGLLRNVPVLEQAASGRGLFTIRAERDGIVRRVPIVMQAQGMVMPSLSLEMLRVASGSNTVLIRSDHAGVQSAAVPGLCNTDRPKRPAMDPFLAARQGAVRVRGRRARRSGPCRPRGSQAGADRHFSGWSAQFQDHPDRPGHAGRRSACAGSRKHAHSLRAVVAQLRDRRGAMCGAFAWPGDHLAGADPEPDAAARTWRRNHCRDRRARRGISTCRLDFFSISPIRCCRARSSI